MEKFDIPEDPILAATVEKFNELIDLMDQDEKPSYTEFNRKCKDIFQLIDMVPAVLRCVGREEALRQVDSQQITLLSKRVAAFVKSYTQDDINKSYIEGSTKYLMDLGMKPSVIDGRVKKIIEEGLYMKVVYPEIRDDETAAESRWANIETARKVGRFGMNGVEDNDGADPLSF